MAIEIIGHRTPRDLFIHPRTPHDEELMDTVPIGKDFRAVITFPRSLKQNKFYWAMLGKVVENHDHYQRSEELHLWIKQQLGYVDEVTFHDGQVYLRISSTAFWSMDHLTFTDYLRNAINLIVLDVIPGLNRNALIREIEHMTKIRYRDITKEN